MTNGNDNVMPTDVWCESRDGGFYQEGTDPGLTKREYFAAMAMQGILASMPEMLYNETREGYIGFSITAERAKQAADALIAALNR